MDAHKPASQACILNGSSREYFEDVEFADSVMETVGAPAISSFLNWPSESNRASIGRNVVLPIIQQIIVKWVSL